MSPVIHAQVNQDHEGGFCLYIFNQEAEGKGLPAHPAKPIQYEEKEIPAGKPIKATLVIPNEAAQILFDDLWNSGLRPRGDAVNYVPQPLLQAKEDHIKDLSSLFKLCLEKSR